MKLPILPKPKEAWRIIVVGAEDVSQHMRKAGHRVLALEELPALGLRSADAAILEVDADVDARSARVLRSKLVEPVLIHRRRVDRVLVFLSLPRRPSGELSFDLLDAAVANAVERTRLLRRADVEERAEVDAAPEAATLELTADRFPQSMQKTVVVRSRKRVGA